MYTNTAANLVGSGDPERLRGAAVSADLFPVLGVPAALGRTFGGGQDILVSEAGVEKTRPEIVLSDPLWRGMFGADPGIVGRKITFNEQPFTVIGVMPPSFSFPTRRTAFWIPFVIDKGDYEDRQNNFLHGVGRLKPGATVASARTEMTLIAARSQRDFPKDNANTTAAVNDFHQELTLQSRTMVLALSGAALCVLLIVCANLANLLLARALGRRQELAVRTALGAGRERLIRQLATESIVLAALGGALGVLLAAGRHSAAVSPRAGQPPDRDGARHRSAGPRVRGGAHARHRAGVRARAGHAHWDGRGRQRSPRGGARDRWTQGKAPRRARDRGSDRLGRPVGRHRPA